MKVVHLATTDLGGSYKAAQRIHQALCLQGVDSKILLRSKYNAGSEGEVVVRGAWHSLVSKTKNVGNLLLSKGEIISDYFGTDMSMHPDVRAADAIILHWVNSFISYRGVERLLKLGKPVLWVAHDMWSFTGGCHCDAYCGRYAEGCGKCPFLSSGRINDLSRRNFIRKRKAFSAEEGGKYAGRLTLVGPSRWIADSAARSKIWEGRDIVWIHNPVDYRKYRRLGAKETLRRKYGIPEKKKVILFGSVGALTDQNKGAQGLREALGSLDKDRCMLAVFGNREGEALKDFPLEVRCLGYIGSEESMTEVYNLADVFLSLSRQESFCYTVAEALACGVPVVGFAVGGIAEQVRHKENGYLARLDDYGQIREGLAYCMENEPAVMPNPNSLEQIGKQYKELIEKW